MGTNKANPVAMILSGSMLLRHLGYVPRVLFSIV
jgi:isocitrate/isopropylmalate dehydrogenase